MMGSSLNSWRAKLMSTTWLSMLPNHFIFSDADNDTIPHMLTLPELRGQKGYGDAQQRQIFGMRWIAHEVPPLMHKKWFILADDDTWFNVPAMLDYFSKYNEKFPLAFGLIFDDVFINGWATFSGGAGIVLSQAAFTILAREIYGTKELCQFDSFNDFTFSKCLYANGVLRVHSDKFSYEDVYYLNGLLYPPYYVNKISFHYVHQERKAMRMTCDAVLFWRYKGVVPAECELHRMRLSQHLLAKDIV